MGFDPGLLAQVRARRWFYRFELPDGTHTESYLAPDVAPVHATRLAMLDGALDAHFPAGLAGRSVIDLACHQGYFALHLARRGASPVLGVDLRQAHIEDALLMARALGAASFTARRLDLEEAHAGELGVHDITLCLGLLYHLENPVRALRLARAVTRKVLYIETQVMGHLQGEIEWGARGFRRSLVGAFGVIDDAEEAHGPESGSTSLSLVPSAQTLAWLLRRVGFSRVLVLPPPPGAYEQFTSGHRVMMAGFV